jgi:hypothetical protein
VAEAVHELLLLLKGRGREEEGGREGGRGEDE